jgi:hypothetical protein
MTPATLFLIDIGLKHRITKSGFTGLSTGATIGLAYNSIGGETQWLGGTFATPIKI